MGKFDELCNQFKEIIEHESESKLVLLRQEATTLLINADGIDAVRGSATAIYLIEQEFERRKPER